MKSGDYHRRATEGEFQEAVITLAKLNGWMVAHFRPARTENGWRTPMTGDKGFPDLVLARAGRVVFAELKAHGKRLSKEQQDWAAALSGDNERAEVYTWRPTDMETVRVLLSR